MEFMNFAGSRLGTLWYSELHTNVFRTSGIERPSIY